VVRVTFEEGTDINRSLDDVKRRIDALQDLPDDAERIIVDKLDVKLPVINLTLTGDMDEHTLKWMIRQMRDDLELLPNMGSIQVTGVRDDELTVEVSPVEMVKHHLSIPAIADRVHDAMRELPAGPVRAPTSQVSVRTMGTQERANDIRQIIVKSDPSGQVLRLGDIAKVTNGFIDVDIINRINGRRSASLIVFTVTDEDAIDLSEMIKAYAAGRMRQPPPFRGFDPEKASRRSMSPVEQAYRLALSRSAVPEGDIVLHTDLARFIKQRLNLLKRNALWGGMLVFLTLLLSLNWRVAFWVSSGLVISLLGTLAAMYFLNITLNLLTMFGLIIVLGLLVDDAIVVAENIVTRHERGEPALVAAVNGTKEVAWPVVATVLTTIFAFIPLTLIRGRIGDLIGALPIVVTVALSVSLVEAMLILPSHMGHTLLRRDRWRDRKRHPGITRYIDTFQEKILRGLIEGIYTRLLNFCVTRRYFSLAVAFAILFASIALPLGGRLGFSFSPSSDSETLIAEITMPVGTPLSMTNSVVTRLEDVARQQPEVTTVFSLVGLIADPEGQSTTFQTSLGQIYIELLPAEKRDRSSDQVITSIRDQLGDIPGIKSLRISGIHGGPTGLPIVYTVSSDSPRLIRTVVEKIGDMLEEYEGVYDVSDDSDKGQQELQITLRDGAREMGFTTAGVARQIRGAVFGIDAHTFAADQEDVDVRVMADKATRRSLAALERMYVFTPAGDAVPLSEVARITESRTYATIRRKDRRRAVSVSADVDSNKTNPEDVLRDMAPRIEKLRAKYPGVFITAGGREKEIMDSLSNLPLGMFIAALLIYFTLAWLFSSYTQPLVVMLAVPFATIGMIWGHILMGYNLTILSLIGFVALAGIVVNDSLIFMEFYNMKRSEGFSSLDAARTTGLARLRAILLTTITTVLGLSPLMLEQSFQARFLIPMAITISFGLLSATMLTLLLLPALLVIANDVRNVFRFLWFGHARED
ncbi:MAG TPA: efflux RND transporter permease subunit, partial [Phycisphaeraceae bacterium]|nr:efflux RND transporter permease subunit [Phycisphaeraceae bacterium]